MGRDDELGQADFVDRYARLILAGLASPDDPRMLPEEREAILELARIVAHGTERKNAPLVSYITGLCVGAQGLNRADRDRNLVQALTAARRLLNEVDSDSGAD